jgi:D-alanyl-D-alanine carboxypeptidase/D-alanyl-D-alanine-endopeptidase (penicillin-binding protein 4)
MRPCSRQSCPAQLCSARSFCAIALVLILQLSAVAQKKPAPKKDLNKEITAVLDQSPLNRAHWGIDVIDQETGATLYVQNPDQLFLPASNTKLFTTAAALAIAGPDYRFHTTVETQGKIDDHGRLQGDLVIVGRGDPNISGRVMPYSLKTERMPPHTQILEEMADLVAKSGLKIVDGDLIGDDTYYEYEPYGTGWAVDDLQWSDGAPVSALTFNDNVVFLNVLPGAIIGDKALVTFEPETNYYELDNRIVTTGVGMAKKIGVHRDPGSKKVVLWGSVPVNDTGTKETLAIEDPAEFVAQLFRGMLEKRGITIHGKTWARHGERAQFFISQLPLPAAVSPQASNSDGLPAAMPPEKPNAEEAAAQPPPAVPANINPSASPSAQNATGTEPSSPTVVLAEHVSLPFLEDIRVTNKTSQNLHAELALRLAGKLRGVGGSFEGGEAAVRQFLLQAGLKDDEFSFLDGSGLSRRDLATPAAAVELLSYAAHQPWGAAYEESLPVGGVDGSLADRFLNTPAAGHVHAKTGTLSHVSALSGYGQMESGRRFIFSIFCNDYNMPASKVLAAMDAVVRAVVTEEASAK